MHVVPEPINAEHCAKMCKLYQTLPDCSRLVFWALSFGGSADWRQGRLVYRITQLSSSTKSFYCDTEVFGNFWQPHFFGQELPLQQGQLFEQTRYLSQTSIATKSTLEAIVNHQKKLAKPIQALPKSYKVGPPSYKFLETHWKNHSHPLTTYQRSIFKIIEQVSHVETMVYHGISWYIMDYHGISILSYKPSCRSSYRMLSITYQGLTSLWQWDYPTSAEKLETSGAAAHNPPRSGKRRKTRDWYGFWSWAIILLAGFHFIYQSIMRNMIQPRVWLKVGIAKGIKRLKDPQHFIDIFSIYPCHHWMRTGSQQAATSAGKSAPDQGIRASHFAKETQQYHLLVGI